MKLIKDDIIAIWEKTELLNIALLGIHWYIGSIQMFYIFWKVLIVVSLIKSIYLLVWKKEYEYKIYIKVNLIKSINNLSWQIAQLYAQSVKERKHKNIWKTVEMIIVRYFIIIIIGYSLKFILITLELSKNQVLLIKGIKREWKIKKKSTIFKFSIYYLKKDLIKSLEKELTGLKTLI